MKLTVRRLFLKPDIIRYNRHKIIDNRRKNLFTIEIDFKDVSDNIKSQVIEMINKKICNLRTTDIQFLKIEDKLKKYGIRIVK